MGRFKELLIREGKGRDVETVEEQSRETIAQPWGRVLVPHKRIHTTIPLSCFEHTGTPTRWEKLTVCCPEVCRRQTCWNQKVGDADAHLPHHQPIRRMSISWSRPLCTITIKFLTTPSRLGHTVLRASAHCVPLCLAKQSNSSFLLYPNSVSEN